MVRLLSSDVKINIILPQVTFYVKRIKEAFTILINEAVWRKILYSYVSISYTFNVLHGSTIVSLKIINYIMVANIYELLHS